MSGTRENWQDIQYSEPTHAPNLLSSRIKSIKSVCLTTDYHVYTIKMPDHVMYIQLKYHPRNVWFKLTN
jgi:hypothetical protein